MIVSKTPLRISFVGGGTDLKSFFSIHPGAVVNMSIDKYVYIVIHKFFGKETVLKYSKTETIESVDDIEHPLFRESLKIANIGQGMEIASLADITSKGTGLGSSSTFLVGLLNALYAQKGIRKSKKYIAETACKIERDLLKEHGGYQDQYIATYGGLNYIEFFPDNTISVNPIICSSEFKKKLANNLLMFYTGITRKSGDIHKEQDKNTKINVPYLQKMKLLADTMRVSLEKEDLNRFGELLHENWMLKKSLSQSISTSEIDKYYNLGIKNGAIGGKICGAGGGGFLMFYAEEKNHAKIREALSDFEELKFGYEPEGTRIVYHCDN